MSTPLLTKMTCVVAAQLFLGHAWYRLLTVLETVALVERLQAMLLPAVARPHGLSLVEVCAQAFTSQHTHTRQQEDKNKRRFLDASRSILLSFLLDCIEQHHFLSHGGCFKALARHTISAFLIRNK